MNEAREIYERGGFTCVLTKGEKFKQSDKRGIVPLIEFINSGQDFRGYTAADKIVGKAAALLYVYMGVKEVYGEVMSESAAKVFRANCVACAYTRLTDKIINRSGDGICPMESAVEAISSPQEAYKVLKAKVDEMKKRGLV